MKEATHLRSMKLSMTKYGRSAKRVGMTLFTGCLVFLLAALLMVQPASAHILNEKSQFPDIEATDARFDIIMLVGAGIIPQTPVFEPERPLSRHDLASWAALANGLLEGGEKPDVDRLAEEALSAGLVDSLDGEATYEDIDQAIFSGRLGEQSDEVPTRAEAAAFIAEHFMEPIDGESLMERLGLKEGPKGIIEAVDTEEDDHGHGAAYVFTIDGEKWMVDHHGRVGNGPTDLLQWEGMTVSRSLVGEHHGDEALVYVEAGTPEEEPGEDEESAEETLPEQLLGGQPDEDEPEQSEESSTTSPLLVYGIGALAVILAIALFVRKKG